MRHVAIDDVGRTRRPTIAVLEHRAIEFADRTQWSREREGYDAEENRKRWDAGFAHQHGKEEVLTMYGVVKAALANGCEIDPEWLDEWEYRGGPGKVDADARGNAQWLVQKFPDKYLHYLTAEGSKERTLRVFNGRVWESGDDCKMLVEDMVPLIAYWNAQAQDAMRREETKLAKALTSWARACRKKGTVEETRWELARHEDIETTAEDFDNRPELLCVANGTLNLDTGELQPHSHADRLTTYIPVAYSKDAEAPLWKKVIRNASKGDPEWRNFLQRALGYCVSGHTQEQVLLFWQGLANSGKSTLIETLCDVLGSVHTVRLSPTSIRANGHATAAGYELARLQGRRIAVIPEITRNEEIDVEQLKRLSGEDTITTRQIYMAPIQFRPRAKLILVGNTLPKVDATNEAFWRRVLVVPFDRAVPPDERDPYLRQRLLKEAPGILAWCVRGYGMWKVRALKDELPERMRLAVTEFRAKEDPLETWYAEETQPKGETQGQKLYDAYCEWFRSSRVRFSLDADEEPITLTAFGRWLGGKGHEGVNKGQHRVRKSISLRFPDG